MGVTKAVSRGLEYVTVPEPGQLVEVRRRQWVVADIQASERKEPGSPRQHYVTLASIDEDGLGDDLQVVWEIEPGARVIERAGLPALTGRDDSRRLDAFLDAVRWGAATNADRGFLQAPFRSGVSIEDFQLDPLVRAIDMARVNLLIADDVGLGKTIEAGLVIQELLLRHRARTVLVVCPASLQEKWRVEMHEKFGLEFEIVDTDYIKRLRRDRGIHANPWSSFPRLISSMDWMKSGEPLRTMRDILPPHPTYPRKFDVLVVDEAHNVAPAAAVHYAMESQRTRLVRTIGPHFQHRLFLTATPHNGYDESFTSLLELLDDQRFARNVAPDEKKLAQVMVRRLKTDLTDSHGNRLYPERILEALPIRYTPEERAIHRTLDAYRESRERTTGTGRGAFGTKFVNTLLKKRLFSSPAAFASTLARHIATLEGGRAQEQRRPDTMADGILKRAIARAEEDYAKDGDYEAAQAEAVEEATRYFAPLTAEERRSLDVLRRWAERAQNQVDSKAQAVIDWIEANLKTDGRWNGRRVILFTEYRTTHQWLHQILASHGYGGDRLALLHGDMDRDDREPIKAAFQADPEISPVRILLATDAASEGIDLQNHCSRLIHLEIPYNPNVMEQRNGRIDRHGQRERQVLIWHPVDGGDEGTDPRRAKVGGHAEDILRALRKIDAMRVSLGSVNALIEPQISEILEGRRNDLDMRAAEQKSAAARRYVRAERQLNERIAKLHERLGETRRDFHLTPERIRETVTTGLALAGKPPLKPVELDGVPDGSVFAMPALSGSWARCLEGLPHPFTGAIRPITFDHEVAKGRDDLVLVHLNHRLVQMCLRLLRAEVWAQEDVKRLHRVDVRGLPPDALDGPAVVVIARLVVTGGKHHRLHEELTVSGGYLDHQRFSRESRVTQVNEWLEGARSVEVDERSFSVMASHFTRHAEAIEQAVEARSKDRLRNLRNTLQNRMGQEILDIGKVLDELARAIDDELRKEDAPRQLDLFTVDERNQHRRDFEALKARLARIPQEREREIAAIRQRYADFTERTFPVAIVFLVPESETPRVAER